MKDVKGLDSMKPGYYLSEHGNFHVWYPKDFFKNGYQRVEIICATKDSIVAEYVIDCTEEHTDLILATLYFEYIGEL